MDFQQTRTYANLKKAYETELHASSEYRLYGNIARKEDYIEISNIFNITSGNELEHARIWLQYLNNGILPTTEQNLLTASSEEALAGGEIYREYARVAREEGYNNLAALFNGVANIELNHNLRFRNLYTDSIKGELFCKPLETLWICQQCGNIMAGLCAPDVCPVCGYPQGYYKLYECDGT